MCICELISATHNRTPNLTRVIRIEDNVHLILWHNIWETERQVVNAVEVSLLL